MTAAELIGHLHLRQVEVLRTAAYLHQIHGVLDKGRVGGIRRREENGNGRLDRFVLRLRVVKLGPFLQLLEFLIVVLLKIPTNSFH